MFITRFVINRPVVVRMAILIIVILGTYSYVSMPRYLDPDLTVGEAIIVTLCPGYSPEEMEKLVTNKIEDELDGISEIKRYESNSFESTSKIHIYFQSHLSDYEIDQAMQEVRNAVDRVEDLPEDAKVPKVIEVEIALFPVCMVGLSGDLPMMELQEIARDVADEMENIDGVSEVVIHGERDKEIWIEIDPGRMSAYGISIKEVAKAISDRTSNLPGGTLDINSREIAIRMLGEPDDVRELGNIVIRSVRGKNVYLRDIARITPTLEKPRTLTFIDNKPALVLSVKRKRNTNIIRIVDSVKAMTKNIEKEYPGIKTTIYFDQSRVIKKRIKELQINAMLGMIAVFFILWISMGMRNAIFASIGIPFSFLITFILMKIFNLSVDGVTLFGLILVLGILVDDAIVVIENIFRYMESGYSIKDAVITGSREVVGPVIASVSTNMAAFFPLLFMIGGVIGRYLAILPKVVLFALSASLFEAFFMLPSHVVELTSEKSLKKSVSRARFDIFSPLRRVYYPYLRMILKHRYISVLVIVLSTILAFFLYFQTDFELFPKTDAFPRFNIHFDLPVGATLEESKEVLMKLSDLVKEKVGDELEAPIAIAGMKEINYEPVYGYHYGILNVILKPPEKRKHSVVQIMEKIRPDVDKLLRSMGVSSYVMERLLEGPPVGADVDLKIQSRNWETSAEIARLIEEELSRHKGIVDIQDNYSKQKQLLEITVDEDKAKALGIDQEQLVIATQSAFHGFTVGKYHRGEEEQEIRLKYLPEFRKDFDDLLNIRLLTNEGTLVPLKEVAKVRLSPGFHNIYHYNGKQTVRITASIKGIQDRKKGLSRIISMFTGEKMTSVRANQIAQQKFNSIRERYPGASMTAGGLQEETNTSLRELRNAGILALLLIFFILALEFNSFSQPFIIMITIPFVTLGVIVGLIVHNNPITFVTLIGMLALSGIVVNDSLVLIDFINRYWMQDKKHLYRAIVKATHVRLRPILLTSITTIFGLAPMAFGLGGKSPFWAPLATAIMWGLGFSTILILTMVPAYYAILQDMGYFIRHRKRRKAETIKEIAEAFQEPEISKYMR